MALLSTLYESAVVSLPAPLWYDATGGQLGSKAIVMEMVGGESLLARFRGVTDPAVCEKFDRKLCEAASAIHTLDINTVPTHVTVPSSWDDYIDGRIQRWADAECNYSSGNPMMRFVAAWLRANEPPPAPLSLVHGDFRVPTSSLVTEKTSGSSTGNWPMSVTPVKVCGRHRPHGEARARHGRGGAQEGRCSQR